MYNNKPYFGFVTIGDCFSRKLTGFDCFTILDRDCFSRKLTGMDRYRTFKSHMYNNKPYFGFVKVSVVYSVGLGP
jgi:hypothetical protein